MIDLNLCGFLDRHLCSSILSHSWSDRQMNCARWYSVAIVWKTSLESASSVLSSPSDLAFDDEGSGSSLEGEAGSGPSGDDARLRRRVADDAEQLVRVEAEVGGDDERRDLMMHG